MERFVELLADELPLCRGAAVVVSNGRSRIRRINNVAVLPSDEPLVVFETAA
jgi:hypothetical protein